MSGVVVVGDSLVDRDWTGEATRLCPDSVAPVVDMVGETVRPGGAALAALAAAACGGPATLVTAIGDDEPGDRLREHLARQGVHLIDLGLRGATPEKVRVQCGGVTVVRLDRGCRTVASPGPWTRAASNAVHAAGGILVSDYGRGAADLLRRVPDGVPVVWDPHPRGRHPHVRVDLATPSRVEAAAFAHSGAAVDDTTDRLAELLAARWGHPVVVTCGAEGAVLRAGDTTTTVPSRPVEGDPCGAGDWFAAAAVTALSTGADLVAAVEAGSAAARRWIGRGDAQTVVATSGCFDVLHVGHLSMLRHARSLGDRLVVLVNSDASVRRLKGSGRPVNHERDRVALLAALDCVDEVRVFDEPTPCAALDVLRPAVFVKGEDYRDVELPEAAVLSRWGGRIELAPLVADRSTTRVLQLAQRLVG